MISEQFFDPVSRQQGDRFVPDPDLFHHAFRVLRLTLNSTIWTTDGIGNRYQCSVIKLDKRSAEMEVIKVNHEPPTWPVKIHTGIGLIKNAGRVEWLVEKVTELGVTRLLMLQSDRTQRETFRSDRLKKIAVAGLKQSLGSWLPAIETGVHLDNIPPSDKTISVLFFHEKKLSGSLPLKEIPILGLTDIFVLFGPEGGWSDSEIELAESRKWTPVWLGPTRFRTETAVIAGLSVLYQQLIP